MDKPFKIHSKFQPTGDQPQAIEKIAEGFKKGLKFQTLKGVTGSGKTFTMANIVEKLQKPTPVSYTHLSAYNEVPHTSRNSSKYAFSTGF